MNLLKRLRKVARLPLLATLTISATHANAAENIPDELVMGIISTESSSQLRKGFDPFIEALSEKLQVPVKAYFATDYAGVIEAMRFNKIHLAWLGNKSALEAVDRAEAEVFAQVTRANGVSGYHSVIVVHRDSPFQSIDEILDRRTELNFGNGDPNSTSGYLIPSFYLWAPKGIDPQRSFKRTRNANHEVNCIAVAMRQVDFATANDEALLRFEQARPKLAKELRVIWKSPTIPNDPIVMRRDLSRDMKARIKGVFLSFGRIGPHKEEELKLLAGIQDGWGTFNDSDNSQLLPIREIAVQKEIQSLTNRDQISETERSSRLAKLNAEKSELARLRKYTALLQDGMGSVAK